MHIRARQMELSPSLRKHVEDRLGSLLGRFGTGVANVNAAASTTFRAQCGTMTVDDPSREKSR